MPPDKVCKTVFQYNKLPIPPEDMQKLLEIAEDCRTVRNYVYNRFGGIGGLSKLYPGYTAQNEMTRSGLRDRLGLPSVYFYLAVFDALAQIRGQWTRTKSKVSMLLGQNESLTAEEKHYLRFLLKVPNAFEAALNQKPIRLAKELQGQYGSLAERVDTEKLHRYLCRQVRKYHVKPYTDSADGFGASAKAYKYGDHGIYLASKEKRKRIFIPLTDQNWYESQIYIRLRPEEASITIQAPIGVKVRRHVDFNRRVGLSPGMMIMLTTDEGRTYGELLGAYQMEYSDWMRKQTGIYNRNRKDNPGRKKYYAQKNRYEEQLHSYINHELNRFLQTEKPEKVYIPGLPPAGASGNSKRSRQFAAMWQRGYIRKRLDQKCREQSVELKEVLGKDISNVCSCCHGVGRKAEGVFTCPQCGYSASEKVNAARNAKLRGEEMEVHKKPFERENPGQGNESDRVTGS